MLEIIYGGGGGIAGVRVNETVYAPEALMALAATAERYRAALAALADGDLPGIEQEYARAILGGATLTEATAAAEAVFARTPEEEAEAERGVQRTLARRRVMRAACTWVAGHEPMDCAECRALCDAVAAFLAAGGTEVAG